MRLIATMRRICSSSLAASGNASLSTAWRKRRQSSDDVAPLTPLRGPNGRKPARSCTSQLNASRTLRGQPPHAADQLTKHWP